MPVRLFLSYSRSDDEDFVRRLHDALAAAGFAVWFDRVSMPSRQLSFSREIEDAISACDRLVLIVGPGAVASEYVTHEWQFAFHQALKCINPVVRLNGTETGGKAVDGYLLLPEDLRGPHVEDFRDDSAFHSHFTNLVRQLSEPLPPIGKLVAVPTLPAHYLEQSERIRSLRDMVLADLRRPVVVSGASGRVGLHGMGGIGKSLLANALARRPEIRREFPDGVFWVTLGQQPSLVELQRTIARELGDQAVFMIAREGRERLRDLLKDRAALLILDDVWQRDHAEAFNVIGPRCRLLLTTRDAGLVTALAAQENHYQMQLPTAAEARAILAKAAGSGDPAGLPVDAGAVVEECGRLPLALALCGGMVYGGTSWRDVFAALREHDLTFLADEHPGEEQHVSVWRAIDASVRVLPQEDRQRFAALSVFALDTGAPEASVETLWEHIAGLSARDARKLLRNFAARSLVQWDAEKNRMTLHDLVHAFAAGMTRYNRVALHRDLLEAYRKKCSAGWSNGPNDGYFLENLCSHLLSSDSIDEAVALLTGLGWIAAKSRFNLVLGLQEDYRVVTAALPEAAEKLQAELRRKAELDKWTRVLVECAQERRKPRAQEIPVSIELWTSQQIAQEIERVKISPSRLDRLKAFENFVKRESHNLLAYGQRPGFVRQQAFNFSDSGPVAESAAEFRCDAAQLLLRRRPEFNPLPAEIRILEGPGPVQCVRVTPDGSRAVSLHAMGSLYLWDIESGACLRKWNVSLTARDVSIAPDGRRAVIARSGAAILLAVDLESGASLCQIAEKCWNAPQRVAIGSDARWALSWGGDKVLQQWDLSTGVCLHDWGTRRVGYCKALSVTPDGKRAVLACDDSTLALWDLDSGTCLRTLVGHSDRVMPNMEIWSGGLFERRRPYIDRVHSVSMTADERRAVSGGEYTTRVWDLETGTCLHSVDEGGDASVTPDGQHAVSGGDRLKVWNMHTGDHLRDLDIPSSHIGISADGRTALAAHGTKIRVLDLEKGRCPLGSDHHEGRVRIVAVSLNGRRAISVGDDDALRVWDTQTGDCLRTVKLTRGETSFHVPVYLSVDARWAVSDHGLNLRLWDLDEGKCAGIYRLRLSWLKRLKHFLSSNQSSWMCAPAELDTGLSRQ